MEGKKTAWDPKGGSPLSDGKSQDSNMSLSMPSIGFCTRPHVFILFAGWKTWTFYQSPANDDVKVNKTQRISAKIDRFRTWLTVWILMQLTSQSET